MSSAPKATVKPGKSGLNRKRGRPATMQRGRRIDIYLDAQTIERARELGNGNVSAGVRRALALV